MVWIKEVIYSGELKMYMGNLWEASKDNAEPFPSTVVPYFQIILSFMQHGS